VDEEAFRSDVSATIELYEQANRHAATRTRSMIETHGEVEALSRLMVSADLQQGFRVLRDRGQLDNTIEALVVRYRPLFSGEVVEAAQWRLANPHSLL
jgi:hypothetical protein